MKRGILFVALAALACTLRGGEAAAPKIEVARGEVRQQDINAAGGRVVIAGRLNGSVFMIGGQLSISGEVSEDVICIGTEVDIGDGAAIGKELWVISDHLQRSEKSTVGGRVVQVKNLADLRRMASTILPFLPEDRDLSLLKIIKIIFWFILCLIILAIFPEKVAATSENPGRPLLKLAARGLGYYLLFFLLLGVFSVLSLFLIGIPLLLVLFISFFFALAFGRTVVFYFLGSTAAKRFGLKRLSPAYYILLGILPYALFKFIPVIGMVLVMIMDFFVLGISTTVFLKKRPAA